MNYGDNLIVGKLLGPKELGYYAFAFTLGILPLNFFLTIYGKITTPIFSMMQSDRLLLKKKYFFYSKLLAYVIFPLIGVFFVFIPEIVEIGFGVKWLPAVFVIRLTFLLAFLLTLSSNSGSLFRALGVTELVPKLNIIRLIGYIVILPICAILLGINGVILGVIVATLPTVIYTIVKVSYLLRCKIKDLLILYLKPLLLATLTVTVALIVSYSLNV